MAQGNNAVDRMAPTYTLAGDFCRIFAKEMNSLYRLAFLLTGNGEQAERCFASALEDCINSSGVFQEWARSWARRAVIQSAIRMLAPVPSGARLSDAQPVDGIHANDLLARVGALPSFQRFVFVISVLERYSDQDCRLLLGCSRQEIAVARSEAMERLAAMQGQPQLATGGGGGNNQERRFRPFPFVVPVRERRARDLGDGVAQAMSA